MKKSLSFLNKQLYINILTVSMILFGLSSCEEVIDIELKEADQVLVIEGGVSNTETTHYVYISKTVPFSSNSTNNPQSGAVVKIQEEGTSAERTFTEVSPGQYRINNYQANPGRTYRLTVDFENEQYMASSTMPAPIAIDSIGTVTDSFFGDEEKTVGVVYQDPPGEKNYYRYLVAVNGKPSNFVFAYNDKFNDGKKVQRNLYHEDLDLAVGDYVEVEQHCIDQAVYTYFNGIQSNNPGSAAPANPKSNFSNGALGYFSAHSITRASTTIE
ncbi:MULTISPECIES: DUF4249 domain-containing protein [Olivibacter]|uniref:DUF4249 domain-containing protein n=1 Tax=Olivibacter oleidegradans TaxID=760123 RepID=A0ABV6HLS4_9SPHI|nr:MULTISPECIES: DUF4249 domain-containing protein [Olivibacter]MDM8176018.1 DUF4249 domain-containing protein [Olivibacter sp. 47]